MTYTNDQTVKATAMMDWSRGLDSSITVTTPFGGWEQNSATLRHEGDWDDFNSLADVTVGGQGVKGNFKFLNKLKTDAQLSITTPWAGWEKVRELKTHQGVRIAQPIEHRTRGGKVANSIPGRNGWNISFTRVHFLC